ncbi:uncharacterized protein LOC110427861 [Herrania umbratica]|uniref:Uncharacterized protein LOC110427861 n=1 Tax=Herrania umbratica TaxID=108875 RepID=A0A6J1BIN9_9ROSI|nr:uncharacterized protein LOC110427861 [Herrania umbratica]
MAWTAKFLLPIRQSISQSRKLFHGKFGPLRTWAESMEPTLQNRASKFEHKLNIYRKYVQDFCLSGNRNARSIFGVSVVFGVVYCWSRFTYAMDGLDILVDDYHIESFDASEGEDDRHKLWMLMKKLWLPVFFIFTILVNWDNPFAVAIRVLLFLLSTKPSPSSIYLFVERLCHGYMHHKPHFYICKSLHANKVEVQDYKLLCIAKVEIGDQKLHLIGILGGWWTLPSSLGIYFLDQEQCSGPPQR